MVVKTLIFVFTLAASAYGLGDLFCNDDDFFFCGNDGSGKCIPIEFVCDYVQDCPNNRDEINCQYRHFCSKGEFLCRNGQCIDGDKKCDNQEDCEDHSDEEFCHRQPRLPNITDSRLVAVGTGSALPQLLVDHLEESIAVASNPCKDDQFFCGDDSSIKCVHKAHQCDNIPDCPNKRDEDSCEYSTICKPGELLCHSGECISADHKCDGIADCKDFTDEIFCPLADRIPIKFTTPPSFTTTTLRPRRVKTNRTSTFQKQPRAASDTIVSCNQVSEFLCKKANKCIPAEFRCDKKSDCLTGEDEMDCSINICEEYGMKECADKNGCYYHKCDGFQECNDGSDEEGCDNVLSKNRFWNSPPIEPQTQCNNKEFQSTLVAYMQASMAFMSKMANLSPCDSESGRTVLIEGIPEPYGEGTPSSRWGQDQQAIMAVLDRLNVEAVPTVFYRVGKSSPSRRRPVKVIFATAEHTLDVLANAKLSNLPDVMVKPAN